MTIGGSINNDINLKSPILYFRLFVNGREAKFNGEYEEMRKVTNVLYIKC